MTERAHVNIKIRFGKQHRIVSLPMPDCVPRHAEPECLRVKSFLYDDMGAECAIINFSSEEDPECSICSRDANNCDCQFVGYSRCFICQSADECDCPYTDCDGNEVGDISNLDVYDLDIKLQFNTHWDCWCCDRTPCGCGCDYDHDGWAGSDGGWVKI